MKYVFSLLLMMTNLGWAATDNDFTNSDSKPSMLAPEALRWKVEIVGQVLIFNKGGTQLTGMVNEERRWHFGSDQPIVSNWSFKQKGMPEFFIQHEWDISPTGELVVKLKQLASMDKDKNGDVVLGKLVKEHTAKIENFDPLNWVLEDNDTRRVVVKFSPNLWKDLVPTDIGSLPISSKDFLVYDNQGNLWASRIDNTEGKNTFFGVVTSRGSVFLSYLPFKGAAQIGTAERNRIKIEDKNLKLTLQSSEFLLPRGVAAKVYGYVDLNKRTSRVNHVKSYGGDEEAKFLKEINR